MASKTDIANEALLKIGERRIVSIEDSTDKSAVLINEIWETTVKQVSSILPWKCFTNRATLAVSAATPAFGWDYKFVLPTDCLRVLYVNGYSDPSPSYFAMEGCYLLSNSDTAQLVYTAYEEDPTKYSAHFIECLSVYLASKLAIQRRQDTQLADALTKEYQSLVQNYGEYVDLVETKSLWRELGSDNPIINAALLKVMEPQVVAFNDQAFIPANRAEEIYVETVKEVSREHSWKCLTKRAALTVDEDAPEFEWDYSYPLPDDCLRVVSFNGRPSIYSENYFVQEGQSILTNDDTAELVYVAYEEDFTKYDNLLTNAITALFASRIASQRRRDPNMGALFFSEYTSALSRARTIDCSQRHQVKLDSRQGSYVNFSRRRSING